MEDWNDFLALDEVACNFLIQKLPLGMVVLEPLLADGTEQDFRILYANEIFRSISGISKDQKGPLTLRKLLKDMDATELDKLISAFNEALNEGEERAISFTFSNRHIRANAFKISGAKVGGIFRDITSYVKRQQELLNLINQLPSPAFLVSKDKVVLRANKAAVELGMEVGLPCFLGIMGGKYISQEELDLLKNGLIETAQVKCAHCMADEAFATGTTQRRTLKVDSKYLEVWWIPISEEMFLHYLVDVTEYHLQAEELKRISAKIEEEKAFFQDILDNIPVAVAILEPSTQLLQFANAMFLELFGIRPEDTGRTSCLDLFCKRNHQDCPLYTQGKILNMETQIKTPSGEVKSFIRNELLREFDGLKYMIITLTDVTELTTLNNKLLDAYALAEKLNAQLLEEKERAERLALQAQAASEAKSQFLASMSHEIRTPLNAVIGFSELLMTEPITESQRSYVNLISDSARLLMELIDDILDLARIEAGKLDLEEAPFDLYELLDELISAVAMKAKEKSLELFYLPEGGLPSKVVGDKRRIKQILLNLLGNAVKFTERGHVELRVRTLSANENQVRMLFSVKDTGPGIPEQKLNDIFEPFEQVEFTARRAKEGAGLGLAITKRLVDLMHGKITVESKIGEGALFCVELPLKLEPAQGGDLLTPELRGKRCLVLDDFHGHRVFLESVLSQMGFRVESVDDPFKAFQSLYEAIQQNDPYYLLITDYQMPKLNGLELVRNLRMSSALKDLRVIMTPSVGEKLEEPELKKYRLQVVSKPLRVKELREAILRELEETESSKETLSKQERVPSEIKVLVVEDNLVNQRVAQAMLSKLGIKVDMAGGGREAIELLKRNNYDMVFMDIEMPEMDGFETTAMIRSSEEILNAKTIPIIAMTAHATTFVKEATLASGMNDYISKPISIEALEEVLKKWAKPTHAHKPEEKPPKKEEESVEVPIFERDILLSRLGGDTELMETLIEVFMADLPNQIQELERAIQEERLQDAVRHAHTIKGASANVSAERLRRLALRMEEALKAGDLNFAKENLERLQGEFEIFLKEINKTAE